MNPADLQKKINHISRLLAQRLGAKGVDLRTRIDSRSRSLPRKVRQAGLRLAQREQIMAAPKLVMQLDARAVERDFKTCAKYLEPLGAQARLMQGALRAVTSIVFIVAVTGGAMLVWAMATGQITL
ncbi:hypothetical protein BFP70_00940 [Thioclava sp. SK-1]|uniref:hypothetical protein n=1 Tax=Thioclava sp. SK-1 TaxID=1889770 RepID=UPI0008251AB7|nr:hypothetical protein [Thioclava sp. SK-1]OCX66754.1 hypothetical protein BFP70_00940 [Thioclava sp. SK-1]